MQKFKDSIPALGSLLNLKDKVPTLKEVFMNECKKHGITVYVYGALLEKDMRRLINLGVDGIMTSDWKLLNKVLNI